MADVLDPEESAGVLIQGAGTNGEVLGTGTGAFVVVLGVLCWLVLTLAAGVTCKNASNWLGLKIKNLEFSRT